MAEKLDPSKETASWGDLIYSNMIQNEATLRLLVKKGIISEEEFKKEVEAVNKAFQKNKGQG